MELGRTILKGMVEIGVERGILMVFRVWVWKEEYEWGWRGLEVGQRDIKRDGGDSGWRGGY